MSGKIKEIKEKKMENLKLNNKISVVK